jgi:zinc/manganese transport system substrate-binding protein
MRSSVVLGAVLALSWIAPGMAQPKIAIFACEPEWASLAKELVGDAATITTAAGSRQDPSDVKVTDDLVAAVRKANLVFCSGAGLEKAWLPDLLKKAPNPTVQPGNSGNLMAADFVIPLGTTSDLSDADLTKTTDTDTDTQVDEDTGGNPHVHLNPHNIMLVAEELQQRLSQIDPDNRSLYDKRYNDFFMRWQDATDRWEQEAAGLFNVPVVTEDPSFAYLIDWLGLSQVAIIDDAPGKAADKARIDSVIDAIKKRPVRMILSAPFDSDPAAKTIAAATGVPVVKLPYTVGGDADSPDLFGLFDDTLKLLTKNVPSG